mgnify:CR=1 FL=1
MIKVVLLGAGNLAYHLFRVFKASKDVEIIQIFNHRKEKLAGFNNEVATTTLLSEIKEADFYLISVKDDAIFRLWKSSKRHFRNKETSGIIKSSLTFTLIKTSNLAVDESLASTANEPYCFPPTCL